jgi:hypothetical protein
MTAQDLLIGVDPLPTKTREWKEGITTRQEKVMYLTNQILQLGEAFKVTDKKVDSQIRKSIILRMVKLLKEVQLVYYRISKVEYLKYGLLVNQDILISYTNQEWKSFPSGEWSSYTTIQDILCDFYDTYLGQDIEIREMVVEDYRLELFMFDMDKLTQQKERTNE